MQLRDVLFASLNYFPVRPSVCSSIFLCWAVFRFAEANASYPSVFDSVDWHPVEDKSFIDGGDLSGQLGVLKHIFGLEKGKGNFEGH